jgi:hypothetical protein
MNCAGFNNLIQESYTPRTGGSSFSFDGKFLRILEKQNDRSWKLLGPLGTAIEQRQVALEAALR